MIRPMVAHCVHTEPMTVCDIAHRVCLAPPRLHASPCCGGARLRCMLCPLAADNLRSPDSHAMEWHFAIQTDPHRPQCALSAASGSVSHSGCGPERDEILDEIAIDSQAMLFCPKAIITACAGGQVRPPQPCAGASAWPGLASDSWPFALHR